jgi:hypothetical protein
MKGNNVKFLQIKENIEGGNDKENKNLVENDLVIYVFFYTFENTREEIIQSRIGKYYALTSGFEESFLVGFYFRRKENIKENIEINELTRIY